MKTKRLKKQIEILLGILVTCIVLLSLAVFIMRMKDQQHEAAEPAAETEQTEETISSSYWVNNVEIPEAGGIRLEHIHIPWDSSRRPGEVREIRYITIHETDNRSSGADSAAHSNLLVNDTSDMTGWHYTVDDHSIYHNIPDNEIGWNAGDNRTDPGGNMNGIGIEMCVNLTNDFNQTIRNTASLAAKLLVTYDLKVDDVRLHADFMDKVCPHRLITEGRVAEFYEMIRQEYAAEAASELDRRIEALLPVQPAEE